MRVGILGVVCGVLMLFAASSRMVVFSASDSEARSASVSFAAPPPVQAGQVAIIVNPNNPVSNVSFDTLRKYFKAEVGQWPHGTKVVVAMRHPPGGQQERGAILRSIYGWDENYYQKYFSQGQFNGSIQQVPKELKSTYAMVQYVHYTPGAIGYVPADQLDDAAKSKVKVLSVDGVPPGNGRYRIK